MESGEFGPLTLQGPFTARCPPSTIKPPVARPRSKSDRRVRGPQGSLDKADQIVLPPRHAAVGRGHPAEVGEGSRSVRAVEPAPDPFEDGPEPHDGDVDERRLAEGVVDPGRVPALPSARQRV